ncbi:MAG TPA: hypothetical protein VLY22_01000 [Candidatus Nitrosotalea sp.]|nr:hypothetical protein [Candidatus Nitrosotalea sp.]
MKQHLVQKISALTCFLAVLATGSIAAAAGMRASPAPRSAERDDAGARTAFAAAAPVFFHPRCMNCHPSGDRPLQGDDSHIHAQNVQRGTLGDGKYGMKCGACHQKANVPGPHMPPGAIIWRLPPPKMPMVFQGRSTRDLCEQLKDPARNGGKTLVQIIEHVSNDPLVGWGWDPGEGRTLPALSRPQFANYIKTWVQKGAACPE